MQSLKQALIGTGLASTERDTLAVERTRPFRWLVRAGFAARAVTYGVIGGLALALALGAGSAPASPNQQGALALIAGAPLGRVALAILAAGLLAYALWKLAQGVFGRGPDGGLKDRAGDAAGGVAYLLFFAVAIRVLTGSAGSGSSEPEHAASGVLALPGGAFVIGAAGASLLAVSLLQAYDAIRCSFLRDSKVERMRPRERRVFVALGRVGLVARAVVFALIGYFLLRTAIELNARRTVGVDGALAEVHRQPLGPWLLGFVAAGLLTFALFSLLEAHYRRL